MINALIFSKDRALQLDLLLKSIEKNAKDVFNLNVLYTFSDDKFNEGYNIIIDKHPNVNFIQEQDDFKSQTLEIIQNSNQDFFAFLTDDSLFFSEIDENEIVNSFKEDKNNLCFSLRLGKNTTFCYVVNSDNKLYGEENIGEKSMKWDWQKHFLDYHYPFSISGHVFKKDEIYKFAKKTNFSCPNELEEGLQMFNSYPKNIMSSFNQSVLVNTPINIVQTYCLNRFGEMHFYAPSKLNDYLMSGNTVNYNDINIQNVYSCFQEIKLPIEL